MNKSDFNLSRYPFGKKVIIHDFVGKYGDWLFKQPLISAFMGAGYKIFFASSNQYKPLNKEYYSNLKGDSSLAIFFTRSDKEKPSDYVKKSYPYIIEINRINRFSEKVIISIYGKIIHEKIFSKIRREQERIEAIVDFLGLQYKERSIKIQLRNQKIIVLSFNVGEKINERSKNIDVKEIIKVLRYAHTHGYCLQVIEEKGLYNPLTIKIKKNLKEILQIRETKTIHEAFNIINQGRIFFGLDSGLAHYAVQKGKIVFSLFDIEYHGKSPVFNTKLCNHLTFFGNQKFANEIINYIKILDVSKKYDKSYKFINRFISNEDKLVRNSYSNDVKFVKLILKKMNFSTKFKKKFENLKNMFDGIFIPDKICTVHYDTLPLVKGPLFINSFDFVQYLQRKIAIFHQNNRKINIFAKNCSFFYGTAMKHNKSDIDLVTISKEGLSNKEKAQIVHVFKQVLNKYSFSTDLPHQTPSFKPIKHFKKNYYPIILKNKSVFSFRVQNDQKNIEKFKTRIKIKIIANEISYQELDQLSTMFLAHPFYGQEFIEELKLLVKDKNEFIKYEEFIRKMEFILSTIGPFGSPTNVLLKFDKTQDSKNAYLFKKLISHGLIYVNENRLYLNWDIRRPQHAWFIPIAITSLPKIDNVVREGLKSRVYKNSTFIMLKKINQKKLSIDKAIYCLNSESYLLISEAFHYLKNFNHRYLKKYFKMPAKEFREYLNFKNSNCNDSKDQKINLLSLLLGETPNLLESDIKKLSGYNLFVYYFIHSKEFEFLNVKSLEKQRTKNGIQHTQDFTLQFKKEFIQMLREYYLYFLIDPDIFLVKEKKKEILFMYFVKGVGFLQGGGEQARKIKKFLSDIPQEIFSNSDKLGYFLRRFERIKNNDIGTQIKREPILIWAMNTNIDNLFFKK